MFPLSTGAGAAPAVGLSGLCAGTHSCVATQK